jgi:3',5'-cyclic AMP phosphodiesterase CpdA
LPILKALFKKRRGRLIWVLIPIIIAITIYLKWDNWFYNPPEPAYFPSSMPDRILLTWSEDPCTTRDVTWQCDTLSKQGTLQYFNLSLTKDTIILPSSRRVIKTSGGAAAYYRVGIKDLKSGQKYSYRVGNNGKWSNWYTFKTCSSSDSAYSFIFIGDVQDSINGKSGDLFRKAYASLPDAAFILFIGDMIERPHDEYWKEFFREGGDIFRTIPVVASPGNHEYHKAIIQKIDPRWMAHFSFPQNGPKEFLGRVCYWDYDDTRYISMDTNGMQGISSSLIQRNWLKKVLENTKQRWKVVIMHHPLYSTTRGQDYFIERALFKPLFDKYGVDLVLQGHDHAYGRSAHIPNSAFPEKQGPVYVVTHASPKLYDIKFSKEMDRLGTNTQMYQLISVSKDSICYRAYTFEGTYYDGFTLVKDKAGSNKLIDYAPYNVKENLTPTPDFYRRYSKKEVEKYNEEMKEREKGKLQK